MSVLGIILEKVRSGTTPTFGEYERRRVIVKDGGRVQQGEIDILIFFNRFADDGMLKKEQ